MSVQWSAVALLASWLLLMAGCGEADPAAGGEVRGGATGMAGDDSDRTEGAFSSEDQVRDWVTSYARLVREGKRRGDEAIRLNVQLRRAGHRAIPHLVPLLSVDDERVAMSAANLMSECGSASEVALPSLVRGLKRWTGQTRRTMAEAIGRIARRADLAVPALLSGLEDPDFRYRMAVVTALSRFGPRAESAATPLASALSASKNVETWTETQQVTYRVACALALCKMGSAARPAAGSIRGLVLVSHPVVDQMRDELVRELRALEGGRSGD